MADVLWFISYQFLLLRLRIVDINASLFLSPLIEVWHSMSSVQITIAGEINDWFAILVPDFEPGVCETPTLLVEVVKLGLFCQSIFTYLNGWLVINNLCVGLTSYFYSLNSCCFV